MTRLACSGGGAEGSEAAHSSTATAAGTAAGTDALGYSSRYLLWSSMLHQTTRSGYDSIPQRPLPRESSWFEKLGEFCIPISEKLDNVQQKLAGQNVQQRLEVLIKLPSELFKAYGASFLLLSVPQLCGDDHICTVVENLSLTKSPWYTASLCFSAATFVCLLVLSALEMKRENLLITYLEVNLDEGFTSRSVSSRLTKSLAEEHRGKIRGIDDLYAKVVTVVSWTYATNVLLAILGLYPNVFNLQVLTSLYAWTTLQKNRLDFAASIAHTDEFIFRSAYLSSPVQYNDVDPMWRLGEVHNKSHNRDDDNAAAVELTVCS